MSNYWLNGLSMWTNEYDCIIAKTLEEAKTYAGEMMFGLQGKSALDAYEQFEKDEYDEIEWYKYNPEVNFRFIHDDGREEVKKVKEFIASEGPGYFACTEW